MDAAQQQLEAEIVIMRADIARLKQQLTLCFEDPSAFVTSGDELRRATDRLVQAEAELKSLKLDAREEVWWTSSRRKASGATPLPRSLAVYRARGAR